jgi:uncharacterized protein YutD
MLERPAKLDPNVTSTFRSKKHKATSNRKIVALQYILEQETTFACTYLVVRCDFGG